MICIICKKNLPKNEFSDEHVFPESIGGSFVLKEAVCKKCNHLLGTKIDAPLAKNFFIELKRYQHKISGKKGSVPNPFGEGTIAGTNRKVIWKPGDIPVSLPSIQIKRRKNGSIELNVSVDARKGEEGVSKIAIKKLERMSVENPEEELKSSSTIEYKEELQPTVHYNYKINLLEPVLAFVKIAYEMAYYWLGKRYLEDETGEKLRRFLLDMIHGKLSIQGLSKHDIEMSTLFQWPYSNIRGWENSHCVRIFKNGNTIACDIKIYEEYPPTKETLDQTKPESFQPTISYKKIKGNIINSIIRDIRDSPKPISDKKLKEIKEMVERVLETKEMVSTMRIAKMISPPFRKRIIVSQNPELYPGWEDKYLILDYIKKRHKEI
ncbi:hypothetical protein MTTB_p340 (plasmid) [Methanothermobacter tenebrarum]|uniref:HNH endonuclease 5 domain-containing protein n=1 Tax=Methanothermobacter tenebrarum TaxID=680118 RepID=A0ABM7YG03_9EURY|nr:HNH endonuclease [Methanothermobacter tenebrarum]MBC7128974.1 HNH endonuclease [Thermoplasmatales archaeon]BDH80254.1 hypothetical protein MTTB_p340 [Methanothermobacter tenebrarum]